MMHAIIDFLAVCSIVAAAAGYLVYLSLKRLRSRKSSGGCGGGCSCAMKKPGGLPGGAVRS